MLSPEINKLISEHRRAIIKVVLKSMGLAVVSVFPITLLCASLDLLQTSAPTFLGFVTAVMIHLGYTVPACKNITNQYYLLISDQMAKEKREQK